MKPPRSLIGVAMLWALTGSADSSAAAAGRSTAAGEMQPRLDAPVIVTGRLVRTDSFDDSPTVVLVHFVFRTDGTRWALSGKRVGRVDPYHDYAYDGVVLRQLTFRTDVIPGDEPSAAPGSSMAIVTRSSVPPIDSLYSKYVWFALLGSGMPMADLPEGFGCWILGVNQTDNPCRYEVTAIDAGGRQGVRRWEISAGGFRAVRGDDGGTYVPIAGEDAHLHVDARMSAQFGRWGNRVPERFTAEIYNPVTRAAAPAVVIEVIVESVVADDSGAPFVPTLPPVSTLVIDKVNDIEYVTLGAWVEPGSEAYDFAKRVNSSIDITDNPSLAVGRSSRSFPALYALCAITVIGAGAVMWFRTRR